MRHKVNLQNDSLASGIPTIFEINRWVQAVLKEQTHDKELSIRIVDEEEGAQINQQYRPDKSGATNVLAFPYEGLEFVDEEQQEDVNYLGDIVICAPIVNHEAQQQQKQSLHHWAHMVVHGSLHLLGYDHQTPQQAKEMESLEIAILQHLGQENPYEEEATD